MWGIEEEAEWPWGQPEQQISASGRYWVLARCYGSHLTAAFYSELGTEPWAQWPLVALLASRCLFPQCLPLLPLEKNKDILNILSALVFCPFDSWE